MEQQTLVTPAENCVRPLALLSPPLLAAIYAQSAAFCGGVFNCDPQLQSPHTCQLSGMALKLPQ